MPNALDITLQASAPQTAAGSGASVDIGDRTLVQLTVDLTAITASTVLNLSVQSAVTPTSWALASRLKPMAAVGAVQVLVPITSRYVRLTWTLTGSAPAPSATFSVAGQAHQLYCQPGDLTTHAIPGTALEGIEPEARALACLSASDEAAGYLGMAFTLPLSKWDTDLRRYVAYMAVFQLLGARGFEPGSGKDTLIETRRDSAIGWLRRIADGKLRPPGMVDSTPTRRETEVYVVSEAGRGWGR